MPAHPLDPLSEDEFRSTAAILRRDRGVSQELAVRLDRAGRAGEGGGQGVVERRPGAAPVLVGGLGEGDQQHLRGRGRSGRPTPSSPGPTCPGVCPNFTVDEYHDIDHALHEHAEVLAALAARGITDPSLVLFDVWTYGKQVMPEQWRDRRLGWCDIWVRATPDRQPVRAPGVRPQDHRRHEHPRGARHRGPPRLRLPRGVRRVRPRAHRDRRPRTDLKPLEITQPEGVSFSLDGNELRWQNWTMRLGFNFREGPVIYQVAFDDPRHSGEAAAPRHRVPDVVRGDGGAVPRSGLRSLPADRVRHRRVGSGLHDHLAGARLRLPGRDRLRRCRGARLPGRAAGHPAGDLPARGGQRRAVEARRRRDRRRGPADAADGGLGARDRGQLRVPDLLAVLHRRQHRVRGPRHRPDGDHPAGDATRTRRRTGRWSTPGPTRRSTSTSWSPSSTWTSTARTTPWSRSTRSPRRSRRRTRTVWRCTTQATTIALGERVGPGLQVGDPAGLEGDELHQEEPARRPTPPTSWCRGPRSRRCWIPPPR